MRVGSKKELELFLSSNVWLDMKEFILLRLSDVRDDLERADTEREVDLVNKGRAEELRWINDLPQQLVDEWEALHKEEQDDSKNS